MTTLNVVQLILFYILYIPSTTFGGFNLFISSEEMNRTMGILAEMRYVENGKVNQYSTKFPYRLNANSSHINLSWRSNIKTHPIFYSIKTVSEDYNVFSIVHIPLNGILPLKTEKFAIEHRCTGSRAGQFLIQIHFNISWPSTRNTTYFVLKQEKICELKNIRGDYISQDYQSKITNNFHNTFPTQKQLLIMSLIISGLIFICVIIIIWGCIKKSHYTKSFFDSDDGQTKSSHLPFISEKLSDLNSVSSCALIHSTNPAIQHYLFPNTSTPRSSIVLPQFSNFFNSPTYPRNDGELIYDNEDSNIDIQAALINLHVDKNFITPAPFTEIEGTFGEVRFYLWQKSLANYNGDVEDEENCDDPDMTAEDMTVYGKTLKNNADQKQFEKFILQALTFYNVPFHPNLAKIIGAASYTDLKIQNGITINDYPTILYKHNGFGNLKKFLIQCRSKINSNNHYIKDDSTFSRTSTGNYYSYNSLRTHELVSIVRQVLKAVTHLHRHKVLHKDIGTRNCLVYETKFGSEDRLCVQLSDDSLSRDLFPSDYYCLADNDNQAIKWLPPESIVTKQFTSASDVWMAGVMMWEVMSCVIEPYEDIEPEDIYSSLISGIRLPQPVNCPDEMYSIMLSCWKANINDRPSAMETLNKLDKFSYHLSKYI
ncbi:Tyrosine-protein kinase RYK [Strongyloides ratti]|uniref:Tyrosine-protein kinase RYK n=1 Tax=Strongyloides ratti TaxID=34506 RepID=A0A090L4Y7_STRRB|nr:Tyrosine-protein kinase RYK [Strongyloides ratti]CEF63167.1 Tyrosine-protein kinase RYK [Strongyloides ratti]